MTNHSPRSVADTATNTAWCWRLFWRWPTGFPVSHLVGRHVVLAMRRIRLWLLIVVVVLVVLGVPLLYVGVEEIEGHLLGPWDEPATASKVVGTWRGPARSKLIFTRNGHFTSADLPSSMIVDPFVSAAFRRELLRCNRGTWTIGPAGFGGPGVPPQVEVYFPNVCGGGFGTQLQMERTGSGVTALYFYIGDPDDDIQYQFIKQDSVK
jgi:hypothetical protein